MQDRIRDDKPISTVATVGKIEDILAGKDLSKQALQQANERFKLCEADSRQSVLRRGRDR